MIIDFHTHCFPDKLAPRALDSLKSHAMENDIFPCTDGTQSGTESYIASVGVDYAVICNIATNARQQYNVNSFAIQLAETSKTLIPLGSLHPEGEDKHGELSRLAAAGIRGIKIHPDYVNIEIDDPSYDEIFSLCSEYDFFVVTHAGLDPVSPEHIHASPEAILSVIKRYPKLKLVAAHMGGFACSAGVLEHLVGKNIWLDTSLSSHRPDEREGLIRILKEHDPDKLLFATDTPWALTSRELEFIFSAGLGDALTEKILYQNALALLGR